VRRFNDPACYRAGDIQLHRAGDIQLQKVELFYNPIKKLKKIGRSEKKNINNLTGIIMINIGLIYTDIDCPTRTSRGPSHTVCHRYGETKIHDENEI
jgi:hypothetical protein